MARSLSRVATTPEIRLFAVASRGIFASDLFNERGSLHTRVTGVLVSQSRDNMEKKEDPLMEM